MSDKDSDENFVKEDYLDSSKTPRLRRAAKFGLGQIVRHRFFPFRGVIFDVDPIFNNTEEWWLSIPKKIRPSKDQPFYHLLAENESGTYVAYVSEQNLLIDHSDKPIDHPKIDELFDDKKKGVYKPRPENMH